MMPMANTNKDHNIMNVYNSSIIRKLFRTFSISFFFAFESASTLNKQEGISISDRGDCYEIFPWDTVHMHFAC